jgi:hypothetical protein
LTRRLYNRNYMSHRSWQRGKLACVVYGLRT